MRNVLTSWAVLACWICASPAAGQEKKDLLQEFGKTMLGVGEAELTLVSDSPDLGKEGDKLLSQVTVSWILDRTTLEFNWQTGDVRGRTVAFNCRTPATSGRASPRCRTV